MDIQPQTECEPCPQSTQPPGRVLIVDDEPVAIEPLIIRLRVHGFEVTATGFGREALTLARGFHPDVILLDICLPDIDGLEVCEYLAGDPATADIPVIILSGWETPDVVRRCRAVGGTYYLRKPYDTNVVLLLVSQAVADHRLWHALPPDDSAE